MALAVLSPAAVAVNSGDLTPRKVAVSDAAIAGYSGPQTVSATARLSFPTSWKAVRSSADHVNADERHSRLTLRAAYAHCSYTVTATTSAAVIASADATAAEAQLAPAAKRYLLDAGTRGSSAWRVTHLAGTTGLEIHAVAVTPRDAIVKQLAVGAGQRAYQLITVDARPRPNGECHTGSYRDALAASIGDALATARTRAFVDFGPKA